MYPPSRCLFEQPRPTYLHFFSPTVVPRPSDWPDFAHITGYWFLDQPSDWQPPTDLTAFVETDEPVVFIGFGSMIDANPAALQQLIVQALAKLTGTRTVIGAAWSGFEAANLPDHVLMIDTIPYDWLLPKVSAVVHHGGMGTMMLALRAGVPQVIVPYGLDQPFWGNRIAQLGAGPTPIPRKKLTAEKLAAALHQALDSETMRARAQALGERIRAEDGIGNAVSIIEQTIRA
jgi:sterol 3beta-glucosyltransferase